MRSKILKIIILTILFIQIFSIKTFATSTEEEMINSQKETFGINSFIENANKYTGEFFEGIDINSMLNSAIKGKIDNKTIYKKIINLLGKEVKTGIKSLVSILIIIVIHSILKSISENLQNDNVSKMIYYVQYIAIVTVIMNNFSNVITMVKETATNLVGFMNSLVPILVSLMLYTGSITTSSILEPAILFMINFIGNIIQSFLIPAVLIAATLSIVSKIGDKVQIDKISKTFNSGIIWILGVILTTFVGVISLEGTLSSSIDGITAKTAKAIVSSSIPIVGKILGDAVDTVLGCGIILKNAIGVIGVVIIIGICIMPIIKIAILTISYKILASISEPIADTKIIKLLEQIGDIFKVLLAILCSISVMVIVGTTLVIKISNSGMMYR
ncbi:MAG: stage III sporulation protein AE [Clostridium sp. 27_14]|nr:MAG: stage III sporulation protein AE [Clostridium sp. 27_14]